jgi:UDP-N-acetylmuramate dehydrogenase
MVRIEKDVSLLPYNTFGFDAKAKYFTRIENIEQLQALLQIPVFKEEKHLFLGSGSNILFTGNFEGLVIKTEIGGIKTIEEDQSRALLNVGAGEVWHDLVMHCVKNNLGGIENLSLIPGTTGAAPIQNIGAYGVEVKDAIEFVNTIELSSGEEKVFTKEECCFEYRESVFKRALKEKYFISSVTLSVTKENHKLITNYGAIQDTLKSMNVHDVKDATLKLISDAVIKIRKSKLPDPVVIGNAGSFFKNPTITQQHYTSLHHKHSKIPGYQSINQQVKIPAGWLIEQAGWKGKRFDHVGVHEQQALVLVHYGGGSGDEILQLANKIQHDVEEKFGVTLTPEVNVI